MKKIRSLSTKADAEALAEKIRAYWAKRGVEVTTRVVKSFAADGAIWEIESDLINGLPRALSDLSSKNQNGKGIRLWVQKRPIEISPGIAKTVREDWEADYNDFGSLEGRLEAIRDASGSVKIAVKDFLFPKAIVCSVPERLLESALGSFRKRVEIEGTIHYRRDGTPISIEAHSIEILPEDEELPSADDVRGIMAVA